MLRYGDRVIIRDGSALDGAPGVVWQVRAGQLWVLLDGEILWGVPETAVALPEGRESCPC